MPIRPFLAGRPFYPEQISEMSAALEAACHALSLRMVDDGATRLVAERSFNSRSVVSKARKTLCAMARSQREIVPLGGL